MQFKINKIPDAHHHVEIDANWQEARTLDERQLQFLGLAVSCLGILLLGTLLKGQLVPKGFLVSLLILLLTVPVHELFHALSTPGWGFSPKTIFVLRQYRGLWTPYVSYNGAQPLWRFLLSGMMPTILLTLLPILAVGFLPLASASRAGLSFLAFFNLGISGGDLVLALWALISLPQGALVLQADQKLYWRMAH